MQLLLINRDQDPNRILIKKDDKVQFVFENEENKVAVFDGFKREGYTIGELFRALQSFSGKNPKS